MFDVVAWRWHDHRYSRLIVIGTHARILLFLSSALWAAAVGEAMPGAAAAEGNGTYRIAQAVHVGGEGNYWDYVTVDQPRGILYLTRGSHVMVLDIATGLAVADIRGQERNHGVTLVPGVGRGFISDGDAGTVAVFDLKTYKVLGEIRLEPDVDAIVFDPVSRKVLVATGDGQKLFALAPDLNLEAGLVAGSVELGGKPEFFVVDQGKAYINLTDKNQVVVVDTKTMKVTDRWSCAPGGAPVAMAIDPVGRRLFIGCRNPQRLVIMNADDGKVLTDLPLGAGVDTVLYDGDILASCRDGSLTVARETASGRIETVQRLVTKPWAGTMGLDPLTHTLYLPTAEFAQLPSVTVRAAVIPDSFTLLVVRPSEK